jgi:rhodanese-related sulfurtransferase
MPQLAVDRAACAAHFYYTFPIFLATIAACADGAVYDGQAPHYVFATSAFACSNNGSFMDRYIEFVGNNPILFVLLAAILALIAWTEGRRFMRAHKEVSPTEAVQLINREDALVLDVREDNEVSATGKINGARHVPLSVLKQRVGELAKYRNRAVIVTCGTGIRSAQASDILRQNEFQKLYSLKGGIAAWQNANLPLVKR